MPNAANDVNGEFLIQESILSAAEQLNTLMLVHQAEIHHAYLRSEDGKLSIGLTVEISPSTEVANATTVKAKINFIDPV